MSKYVRVPGEDITAISVAMPEGHSESLTVIDGVVQWPDAIDVHNRFTETGEPEAMREVVRQQKAEKLRALAAELGVTVGDLPGSEVDKEADKAPKPRAGK